MDDSTPTTTTIELQTTATGPVVYAVTGVNTDEHDGSMQYLSLHATESSADADLIAQAQADWESWDESEEIGAKPETYDAAITYFKTYTSWEYDVAPWPLYVPAAPEPAETPQVLVACQINVDYDPKHSDDPNAPEFVMSLVCSECFGEVVQRDTAVRHNSAYFADDGRDATHVDIFLADNGGTEWQTAGWMCGECCTDLADPDTMTVDDPDAASAGRPVSIEYV